METTYDYIIIGGGTAGVTIASLLSIHLPTSRILLLEAGPNATSDPQVTNVSDSNAWLGMLSTGLVVDYSTTPQAHLNNRFIPNCAGRMLSGSSGCNVGTWHRPSIQDCDMLAEKSGNEVFRWGNVSRYIKGLETHFDKSAEGEGYGFEGRIHTTGCRKYPMRDIVQQTTENLGHEYKKNAAMGDLTGLTDFVQCWKSTGEGTSERQHSARVYDLSGVTVLCESPVAKILFDEGKKAVGVELISGTRFRVENEVIVSCGAQRSPQLLMLSGIGPKDELNRHSIPIIHESPGVGQNYADHNAFVAYYKLRHPGKGFAQPFKGHEKPEYGQGMPLDFALFSHIPPSDLIPHLQADGINTSSLPPLNPFSHTNTTNLPTTPSKLSTTAAELLRPSRTHYLNFIFYYPMLAHPTLYPSIPIQPDAYIGISACPMQPLSRGSITLSSTNPLCNPICNPNFLSTATDLFITRQSIRSIIALTSTFPMAEEIECEMPPLGLTPLTPASSDSEIDERVREQAVTFSHPMGTCALGDVCDGEFKVKGVAGVRVCDASSFPEAVGVMPSCVVYVLGEICADLVAGRI